MRVGLREACFGDFQFERHRQCFLLGHRSREVSGALPCLLPAHAPLASLAPLSSHERGMYIPFLLAEQSGRR